MGVAGDLSRVEAAPAAEMAHCKPRGDRATDLLAAPNRDSPP